MVAKAAPLITTEDSHSLNWEGKNSGVNKMPPEFWGTLVVCGQPQRVSRLLLEVQLRERYLWGVAEASSSSVLLGTLQSVPGLSSDVQELLVSLLCTVPWWTVIWPRAIISIYWETALGDSWCSWTPIVENITLHSVLSVALQSSVSSLAMGEDVPPKLVPPSVLSHLPSAFHLIGFLIVP